MVVHRVEEVEYTVNYLENAELKVTGNVCDSACAREACPLQVRSRTGVQYTSLTPINGAGILLSPLFSIPYSCICSVCTTFECIFLVVSNAH